MNQKFLVITLTSIIALIFTNNSQAQETLYLEDNNPSYHNLVNLNAPQVTYEIDQITSQSFYQTIPKEQILIYTRGNCEETPLIPQLENENLPYICRSIDQREQYRELVVLLYDIGVGGSIPLPVIYYHQKVLFDPTLEHINVLTENYSNTK